MRLRLTILACLLAAGFLALLAGHARWLENGPREPRLVRFMRRHNRRDNAASVLPAHGRAVDARRRALALAPDSPLQQAVDDLALAAGGWPVALTLDAALQQRAQELMKGRTGAVVALEPATGRVRALVTASADAWPHRALAGLYPPGSTFKVFLAAAALSEGLDPVYHCPPGGYIFAPSTPAIRDVEAYAAERRGRVWQGFGRLGMDAALAHSSNVYFAQLGVALGPARFARRAAAARLADGVTLLATPNVTLAGAACGIPEGLRAPQLAPVGIGQGALQLTPLAVALFTAAVANDGVLVAPTLLPDAKPALRAQPFTFAAAQRVKRMMRRAVSAGTGRAADLPGLDVCGKTGTAQTGRGGDHAWFTCFAPEKTPRLVVCVLVEHGGFGAEAALPVARALLLTAREEGLLP